MKKNYIKTTSNHLLILNSRRQQATITMVINFRVMTQQIPTIYRKVMMLELRFKKKLIENIFGINSAILFMQIFKHNSHVSLQFEFMSDCNKNWIEKKPPQKYTFCNTIFKHFFFHFLQKTNCMESSCIPLANSLKIQKKKNQLHFKDTFSIFSSELTIRFAV